MTKLFRVVIAISLLTAIIWTGASPSQPVVAASCYSSNCREYAVAILNNAYTYTAVHAYIEAANPGIRDGGFSSEVIWIASSDSQNYVELGWRKTSDGSIRQYWETTVNGVSGPINWISSNSSVHDYQIEHKTSDNKWHISVDGSEKAAVSMSFSQGWIEAGGEVTDVTNSNPPNHNAIGVAGLLSLSYMQNHTGYYSWNGWSGSIVNSGYYLTASSGHSFQNGGYNP
ncbi:MAG: hypothetical protein H0U76_31145 [Ktedonobacteraceae bacterium]|nr:hypothetical protein [Ktedonobacteraceae bacterium]